MKGLVWNCKEVRWKKGNKQELLKEKCLLVYICCETGDTNKKSREVSRRIMQLNKKRFGANSVILFPFAHLSNNILGKNDALSLIKNIHARIEKNIQVLMMGFDENKEVKIHLLPNNKDVSYFSY